MIEMEKWIESSHAMSREHDAKVVDCWVHKC